MDFVGLIYDAQYVIDNGGFGSPTAINTYFDLNPIPGTGPYVISDVSVNSYVEYTQNPAYWGANLTAAQIAANPFTDPGHAKTIIVKVVPDDLSRYTDVSTGAVQMATIDLSDLNLVFQNPTEFSYATLPADVPFLNAIALNVNEYPTNITDVRQAIVHGINDSAIIQDGYLGYEHGNIVGPEYPVYGSFYDLGNLPAYSYNVTLAAQYLAEAGFPKGANLPAISTHDFKPVPEY